jgi:hypothetical protein
LKTTIRDIIAGPAKPLAQLRGNLAGARAEIGKASAAIDRLRADADPTLRNGRTPLEAARAYCAGERPLVVLGQGDFQRSVMP